MIEWQRLEWHLGVCVCRDDLWIVHGAWNRLSSNRPSGIRHDERTNQGRQSAHDLPDSLHRIDVLTVEPVAVAREQDFRSNLAEPLEHPLGAEVRRAR